MATAARREARVDPRLPIVGVLIALAAVAWWGTAERMGGMDDGPGSDPGTLAFYVSTWVVMMAAMMFPSIAPMVLVHAALQRGRREKGMPAPAAAGACFVGGYLVVWTAAGLAAYGALRLGDALDGGVLAWDRAGPWVAAGVLASAAVYELTPLKHACLKRCRGPVAFLVFQWREGRTGALRMGVVHGAWCVGCCWALMAALFAVGAMSLAWMAVVAALIAVEKLLPWRRVAVGGVTVLLAALAVGVAVAPERVPGLTIPGEMGETGMDMSPRPGMRGG